MFPLVLITGLVHSPARALGNLSSFGILDLPLLTRGFPDTPPPPPTNLALPSTPEGSVPILTSAYSVICSLSLLPPGSGLVSHLCLLQTLPRQAVRKHHLLKRIASAAIVVLKLKGAGKAISPSKGAELVVARCCGQKLDSQPPNPSTGRLCGP